MLAKVGALAYRLCLPPQAKIHLVFHVSMLNKKVGPVSTVSTSLPEFDDDGKIVLQPVKVLARKLVKYGNFPTTQLLMQWAHLLDEEAIWEFLDDIRCKFLQLLS